MQPNELSFIIIPILQLRKVSLSELCSLPKSLICLVRDEPDLERRGFFNSSVL
jgi:hypothetical protein